MSIIKNKTMSKIDIFINTEDYKNPKVEITERKDMKVIRQAADKFTRTGLVSNAWFTESKQDVIKVIGKKNYLKLQKQGIFKSDYATFKII